MYVCLSSIKLFSLLGQKINSTAKTAYFRETGSKITQKQPRWIKDQMNTQFSTRKHSDDQYWMFLACAIPCCVVCISLFLCIPPGQENTLTCWHFSIAVSLSLASSHDVKRDSCGDSPATRNPVWPKHPVTASPLCLFQNKKIRIPPHPAQAPASLSSHSPPTFHPDFLRTDFLRWMQGVLCKKQIHFQPPYIQNGPQGHKPLLTLETYKPHIKQVISYNQSQNK